MRSGCHTSRSRCSSPATRKNTIRPLSEYAFASGHRKRVRVSRIVTAVVAVSAIGGLLALFSIDSTRAVIVNAKASLGGGAPVQFGAAERSQRRLRRSCHRASPHPHRPNPRRPYRTRQRLAAHSPPTVTTANALASASPSRDEITAAYQSAVKGKVAVPEPVAREAAREAAPVVPAVRETDRHPAKPLRQGASIRMNSRRC